MTIIKTGQVWDAADGGSYGLIVLGSPDQRDDVRVMHFYHGTGKRTRFDIETVIDAFKLTYRYKLRGSK